MIIKRLEVAGSEAARALEEHRAEFPKTGWYPFLMGDEEETERLLEHVLEDDQAIAKTLNEATAFNVEAWFDRKWETREEEGLSVDEIEGEWPGEVPVPQEITLVRKTLAPDKFKKRVYLGLVEIAEAWQLPAVLAYGGWNECPWPAEQCAFHRRWQERYGAEIVALTTDVMECLVTRPPMEKTGAIDLAWEQYWYCPDIVEQGCETVSVLGASLLRAPYWFFWWD